MLFSSDPLSIWREGQLVTGREEEGKNNCFIIKKLKLYENFIRA
jgi:hypothetical protein